MKRIISLILLYLLVAAMLFQLYHQRNIIKLLLTNNALILILSTFVSFIVLLKLIPTQSFYSTLRHELCHWFFSLFSLSKPQEIRVNPDGSGFYSYQGKSNYFNTLAPYFFPLVTFFLLLFSLFFASPGWMFYFLLGLALGFDLVCMKRDYHFQQSDWHKYGSLFSVQFSILLLIFFLISFLLIIMGGFSFYFNYLKEAFFCLYSFLKN